ncbi:ATP-binding protein [Actinokineospora alba]|uniref:ATP-binding protein n=1 Tax=Actinokineospora alba TaxID=504798 RepID=UPI000B81BAB4|nr:ATP-binding protein [Actinokineospora alba]
MTHDPVIEALLGALAGDAGNHPVRVHLANLLLEAGRTAEALEQATTVLAAQPDNVEALRVAATAARAVGDEAKATAYARLATALDPAAAVPDTADEILDRWATSDPVVEPDIGTIRAAGITLADVGGLAEVKKRLELSFLKPLRNPELRLRFGKSLRGGLLLWGPPGCGKTLVARALAGELGASFYEIGLSDVLDMWIGSSERNLRAIFDTARRNRPCLLFFDEIDALGQKRSQLRGGGSALRGVVNQILAELDGASTDNDGVFVLAASNHPWDIDSALLRPGRFDRTVLVLPPDTDAREAILRFHLRGRPTDRIDLAKLAKLTDGRSGADLALICEQATEVAMDGSLTAGRLEPITQRHLEDAARAVRPSIGEWMETARNYALYGNDTGAYDELAAYLKKRRR